MTYDIETQPCTCAHLRRSHGSYTTEGWSGSIGGGACGFCECPRMNPAAASGRLS